MSLQTPATLTSASDTHYCNRCNKALSPGWTFLFAPGGSDAQSERAKCLPCALLHRPMLKRSLIAALVVGTVLTALNQGDAIIQGQWANALYWKIPLTYCVPFIVASYGALANSKK